MQVKVEYTQKFLGEILRDSYYKTIDEDRKDEEIFNIKQNLYSDPHVRTVEVKNKYGILTSSFPVGMSKKEYTEALEKIKNAFKESYVELRKNDE